jgi:hypothetical protein
MTDIQNATYIPILAVRPAEMNALGELPERDKDLILPAIQIRPWVGSHSFDNTVQKITDVFGDERPVIANIDADYDCADLAIDGEREAITFFRSLKSPANGYENWCEFIEQNETFIPCLQIGDSTQFDAQLQRMAILQRGIVIHFVSPVQTLTDAQLRALQNTSDNNTILFILDCGEIGYRQDLNVMVAQWIDFANRAATSIPDCRIAFSSTSFPHDFTNIAPSMDIKERQLYGVALATAQTQGWHLVYSDRGSARVHRPRGGGGVPYPRIDYPTNNQWFFFRSEDQDGDYQPVALATIESDTWNPDLRIWGTQMIERTSQGDEFAITSPVRATAVRINIHLHQQLFHDQPENLLNTDDEWVD